MKKTSIVTTLALLLLVLVSGCKKDKDIITPGKVFNPAKFEANIRAAMSGNVVGYQYAINTNGQLYTEGDSGWAIKPGDSSPAGGGPGVESSSRKPQHVASVSKSITAIAAMRCLTEHNITVDDLVYQYLPDSWVIGPGVEFMSFRNLLDHRSGFHGVPSDYAGMKAQIAAGVDKDELGAVQDDYENANFAMFRVIIAWQEKHNELEAIKNDDVAMATETRRIFAEYVQDKIFEPAGITAQDHDKPEAFQPTVYYDFQNPEDGFWTNDEYVGLGGYGFYVSTYEMNAVLAYLMHTETYFETYKRDHMLEGQLGFDLNNGEHGASYLKGGDWFTNSTGQGLRAGIAIFPNGVEASLFINCRDGLHSYQTTVLMNAYNNAWE